MLARLEARGFRNLEPFEIELTPGTHLVLGDNGAGKTSLLEAIYVLSTTRSFRSSHIADCVRHGADGFRIAGEIRSAAPIELEVAIAGGSRRRGVNGSRTSLAEHLAVLPLTAWTAAEADLLTGPPRGRRRFLDRGVVGLRPAALAVIGRYRRTLAEKRQLLARGSANAGELESWNELLATAAAELIGHRAAYAERLAEAVRETLAESGLDLPTIELRYRPSPSAETAEEIAAQLAEAVDRERRLGRPLIGPHRDEVVVRWAGHALRRVASAGERKALGLVLLAAQGRTLAAAGKTPIVLLDDADTELDQGRLRTLWTVLKGAVQVVVTSNRPGVWEELAISRRWRCHSGRLDPEA